MKNEKPNNEFAYPAIFDLRNTEQFATYRGLTKLELISAMCLQGLVSSSKFTWNNEPDICSEIAIRHAKELLKQLEAENE